MQIDLQMIQNGGGINVAVSTPSLMQINQLSGRQINELSGRSKRSKSSENIGDQRSRNNMVDRGRFTFSKSVASSTNKNMQDDKIFTTSKHDKNDVNVDVNVE